MDKESISKIAELYSCDNRSVAEIAKAFGCSQNKVNYWLAKSGVKKRTISEAAYIKHNPDGDPFEFRPPKDIEEAKLFGLGVGLYWGEGTKANKSSVRLGNSDPALLNHFIKFLVVFFGIRKDDLRFHLHTFTDVDLNDAYGFWIRKLGVKKEQFYKPTITMTGKLGTYRKKSEYGVVTVYYCNKKLRDSLVNCLPL